MRSPLPRLTLIATLAWLPVGCFALETGITAKFHPWGSFDAGAWKTVRVVTETLDAGGQVVGTSVADTTTTLVSVDDVGVTLEIHACMEVAGKRFEADPQTVKQGFHGELLGTDLKVQNPTPGEVAIEGRKFPCKVQQLESTVGNGKTATTIYYSTSVAPYILKRKSVNKNPDSETVVDVVSLKDPVELRGETKKGIKLRTVYTNGNGTVTTLADVVPDVPGGVISSRSNEVDKTGRVVRRSTLTLIDYGTEPQKDRTGLFRKRPPRRVKQASRHGP